MAIPERTYEVNRGFTFKKIYASVRFTTGNEYSCPIYDKIGAHIGDCQVIKSDDKLSVIIPSSFFASKPLGTYYSYLKETVPNTNPDLSDANVLLKMKLCLNEVTPR